MSRSITAAFGFAFAFICSSSVYGVLVTFNFQGQVTIVQDDPSNLLSANFSVGNPVSGTYTIDTAAADLLPADPEYGRYSGASFNVTIGGSSWSGSAEHRAFNDRPVVGDAYSMINETGFAGATFGSLVPETFFLQLYDSTASAFSSDALVTTLPDLSDFNSQTNGLRLGNPSNSADFGLLRFQVTSIVPEPRSCALLALAGIVLVAARRHFANARRRS